MAAELIARRSLSRCCISRWTCLPTRRREHTGGRHSLTACPSGLPDVRRNGSLNMHALILAGQTYEGGISGKPDAEAHGAYAFCALACLCILGEPQEMIPQSVAPCHVRARDAVNFFDVDTLTCPCSCPGSPRDTRRPKVASLDAPTSSSMAATVTGSGAAGRCSKPVSRTSRRASTIARR